MIFLWMVYDVFNECLQGYSDIKVDDFLFSDGYVYSRSLFLNFLGR